MPEVGYGNPIGVLRGWIDAITAANTTVIIAGRDRFPEPLALNLPLIMLTQLPSAGDYVITLNDVVFDVAVFASTYDYAQTLSTRLHARLRRDLPGYTTGDVTFNRLVTRMAPRQITQVTSQSGRRASASVGLTDATDIYQFVGTYDMTCRTRIGGKLTDPITIE